MEPAAVDLAQIVPTPRRPTCKYRDPLDEVWIRAAERMGLRVVRADGAYADYDGRGILAGWRCGQSLRIHSAEH